MICNGSYTCIVDFFFKFPNQFVLIPKSLKNHKNFPVQIKKIDRQI